MTLNWPGDDEPPPRNPRKVQPYATLVGVPLAVEAGNLPSARSRRDIAVVLGLVLLLVILGAVLWFVGPLPRVFPESGWNSPPIFAR
jgi:hypothetical protein